MEKCAICGKTIYTRDHAHFVKVKGQPVRWYCKECMKGDSKHDTDGKRH